MARGRGQRRGPAAQEEEAEEGEAHEALGPAAGRRTRRLRVLVVRAGSSALHACERQPGMGAAVRSGAGGAARRLGERDARVLPRAARSPRDAGPGLRVRPATCATGAVEHARLRARRRRLRRGARVSGGPVVRRLSGEQLWDSLVTQFAEEPDAIVASGLGVRAEPVYARYEELAELSADELDAQVKLRVMRQTDRKSYRQLVAERKAREREERDADVRVTLEQVRELGKLERRLRRTALSIEENERLEALRAALERKRVEDDRRKVFKGRFQRASELDSPCVSGPLPARVRSVRS